MPVPTPSDLPADLDALCALALEQNRLARSLPWEQLEILRHQIAQLNRAQFGASSHRLPGQAELFAQPLDLPTPPATPEVKVAGHTRKGRPAFPKDLLHTRIEYDLPEAQKASLETLERIGKERSETLHYEAARLSLIEPIRFNQECVHSTNSTKDGEPTIVTAAAQQSPLWQQPRRGRARVVGRSALGGRASAASDALSRGGRGRGCCSVI
ncbi:transposase [Cupriavidus sp. BIC8F]|uniref:transposase n=1 Tax=Cupriavidus sp. BIC8F TaxID=3079014 RepID=UPI002916E33F|nr:transposase [Cupriavidus sp. BIC8F]